MDRIVAASANAYEMQGPSLVKVGTGVTHYRLPWITGIEGGRPAIGRGDEPTGLYGELLDAEVPIAGPPVLRQDGDGLYLDITLLLDDEGSHASAIQAVTDAHVAGIPDRLAARAAADQG